MNVSSSLPATAATVSYLDDLKIPRDKKDLAQKCTRRSGSDCCDFHVAYRERGHFVGGRGAVGFKPGPQPPSREGDTGRQAGRRA